MAFTGITTDYENKKHVPVYQPAFLTISSNATAIEAVEMEVRELTNEAIPSSNSINKYYQQPDLNTTGDFTFNLLGIPQDQLSPALDPNQYAYPNGVASNEWKRYVFVFTEYVRNTSGVLVSGDTGEWSATGVVEENGDYLNCHYWSQPDQLNQYYIENIPNSLALDIDYSFANNATPVFDGTSNKWRFLTNQKSYTMSEPWQLFLDYCFTDGLASGFATYRYTFNSVVTDQDIALNAITANQTSERNRLKCGLKDMFDNGNGAEGSEILRAFNDGDDNGYRIGIKNGTTGATKQRISVNLINKKGCRKVALYYVNPYGAVDFFEFEMKGNDLFKMGELSTWERSDYASLSDVYGNASQYPQQESRQKRGRYVLELESTQVKEDVGHLVLREIMNTPKAWIAIQLADNNSFQDVDYDEDILTKSNITPLIPVVLDIPEEAILIDRREGFVTISLRAEFSRAQKSQRV